MVAEVDDKVGGGAKHANVSLEKETVVLRMLGETLYLWHLAWGKLLPVACATCM